MASRKITLKGWHLTQRQPVHCYFMQVFSISLYYSMRCKAPKISLQIESLNCARNIP